MNLSRYSFPCLFSLSLAAAQLPCHAAGTAPGASTPCADWTLTDRKLALDVRLECTRRLLASNQIAQVPESVLVAERSHYLQEAAKTGVHADADMVGLLTEARERRREKIWSHSDAYYVALLMVGDVQGALRERDRKHLRVPEVDFSGVSANPAGMEGLPVYWSFTPEGHLTPTPAHLEQGPHIVVYTAPGCGPCEVASKELAAAPQVLRHFRDHSIWINVPGADFEAGHYGDWNAMHADFPVHAIFSRIGWPEWKLPGTPYFFFIRDGKVVSEMLGWTAETRSALAGHLRGIGLQL